MHIGPAKILRGDFLARRRFDQRRAAEKDRALLAHNDGLVAHRRHIGSAGRTRAHDRRDLGNALRAHLRLVEENAPEMLAVGEDFRLVRQVGAT